MLYGTTELKVTLKLRMFYRINSQFLRSILGHNSNEGSHSYVTLFNDFRNVNPTFLYVHNTSIKSL